MSVSMRRKVTQPFAANHVASRRRETFSAGELVMPVAGPESPDSVRFMRINGLRPSRGVECQYIIESAEWNEKTAASS